VIEAWVHYPQLKDFGWHAHGICGFKLAVGRAGAVPVEQDVGVAVEDVELRRLVEAGAALANHARDMLFPEFALSYFGIHDMHFDLLRCVIDIKYADSMPKYDNANSGKSMSRAWLSWPIV
jgi:hypothetical protein